MASSVGMLLLTTGSMIYVLRSKNRITTISNVAIFVLLIIAYSFETALWIIGLMGMKNVEDEQQLKKYKRLSASLFAG